MLAFSPVLSGKLRICALVLALILPALPSTAAEEAKEQAKTAKPTAGQILFDQAPKYLQEQIKNVVLNCSEGTLTPDKVHIYEYAAPGQLTHYAYEYTAWKQHPVSQYCQNSPPLCNRTGCLLTAYTQVKPGVFKQSLRTYVIKVTPKEIGDRQPDGSIVPIAGFEMTQGKQACRLLGGAETCTLNFTWKDNKFTYFGLGAKDNDPAIEPTHEKAEPADKAAPAEKSEQDE